MKRNKWSQQIACYEPDIHSRLHILPEMKWSEHTLAFLVGLHSFLFMCILAAQSWWHLLLRATVFSPWCYMTTGKKGKRYLISSTMVATAHDTTCKDRDPAFKYRFCCRDACCLIWPALRFGRLPECHACDITRKMSMPVSAGLFSSGSIFRSYFTNRSGTYCDVIVTIVLIIS